MPYLSLPVEEFLLSCQAGVIIDVRTPAEYQLGHIRNALNLPLFTDQERVVIGTLYKEEGRDQAVEKGLEFVGPKMAGFVRKAKEWAQGRPIYIYCWRGGMRSGSMAWLLDTAGIKTIRLEGGYKAYRNSFSSLLSEHQWKLVVLGGATGCGKTDILLEMRSNGCQVVDLEGLAHHKGSAFGALGQQPQPYNAEFINLLHECFRKFDPNRPVWCEGESKSIGRVSIPDLLFAMMRQAHWVVIDMPAEIRLERSIKEYGAFPVEDLIYNFKRIEKRLGSDRLREALTALEQGQIRPAAALALHYYDKGYSLAMEKKNAASLSILEIKEDNPTATAQRLMTIDHKITDENN